MADWIINRPKATITCSKCKAKLNANLFMDMLEKWNYCPYCGADMRAEQTEPQLTAKCPFDDSLPCEWVCTEFGKCKYKPKTEPQIAGKHTKQIIIDEAVTEPSTDCSWK